MSTLIVITVIAMTAAVSRCVGFFTLIPQSGKHSKGFHGYRLIRFCAQGERTVCELAVYVCSFCVGLCVRMCELALKSSVILQ